MKSHKITKLQYAKVKNNYMKIYEPMEKYKSMLNMQKMKKLSNVKKNEIYGEIMNNRNWSINDMSNSERKTLQKNKKKKKKIIIKNKKSNENNVNDFFNIESYKDLHEVFIDEKKAIDYLFDNNYIEKQNKCNICSGNVNINYKTKLYRCTRKSCRKAVSIFKDTPFSKQKLPVNEILHVLYEYLKNTPRQSIISSLVKSPNTITRYSKLFRSIFETDNNRKKEKCKKIVEIDESVFSKSKYHRGRKLSGNVWVLGCTERKGVNDSDIKNMHLEIVENRRKETILDFIQRNVDKDAIILTDSFKSYHQLKRLGYNHSMVNHSKNFVDPRNSFIHTQNIENMFGTLKRKIKPFYRGKKYIIPMFNEYKWRHNNKRKNVWKQFLKSYTEKDQ